MKWISWTLMGLFCVFLTACSKMPALDAEEEEEFETADYWRQELTDTSFFDYAKGVENARKKAQHIASIKWTPLGDIPKWMSSGENTFFFEGKRYDGLPFSSVKEVDTYVGHNVSFYTFMSALNNPRSRLYTIDLSKDPYHGVNCATYYGTVCSMSVNYALGIDAPFVCRSYPSIGFEPIDKQEIDAIKICDVVWRSGHVMMVYDLERDSKTHEVTSVTIFEVNGIRKYSRESFLSKWSDGGYMIRRYKYLGGNLDYSPNPFVVLDDETKEDVNTYHLICPDKGDRTCYRTDEPVIINILADGVERLEISDENGRVVTETALTGKDFQVPNLTPGLYSAKALGGGSALDTVSFEVVDTNASAKRSGKNLIVDFHSSNAKPCYAILCSETGSKYALKQFTDADIAEGKVMMGRPDVGSYYVKVAFKGQYGIITNPPILVKR